MKLTFLLDNNAIIDRYLLSEPGLSILLEDSGKRFLFDTGYSGIFMDNAASMGIDLSALDGVILSHGHNDHCGGLERLLGHRLSLGPGEKLPLICHPQALLPKVTVKTTREGQEETDLQIGNTLTEEKLLQVFDIKYQREPLWLTPNLLFLGQIERSFGFENRHPIGKVLNGPCGSDDFLYDDTALVYKSTGGLVIITGCSHSGICNIISYARKVCKDDRIADIIGGFHLLKPSQEQLDGISAYMRLVKPVKLHPCHCTDFKSKAALLDISDVEEAGTGLQLEFSPIGLPSVSFPLLQASGFYPCQ